LIAINLNFQLQQTIKLKIEIIMRTKILVIAVAAIGLLSFTLISRTSSHKEVAKQEAKGSQSGFALQDSNQF
jgi:hypothetical protein